MPAVKRKWPQLWTGAVGHHAIEVTDWQQSSVKPPPPALSSATDLPLSDRSIMRAPKHLHLAVWLAFFLVSLGRLPLAKTSLNFWSGLR